MTLRLEIAIRIVIEDGDAIFDVVIHGINLATVRINLHACNEADFGLRADNLPHGRRYGQRVAAGGTLVRQDAFAVFVAHDHAIPVRVQDDAVEGGVGIDHVAKGRKLAFGYARVRRCVSQNLGAAVAPPGTHIARRISGQPCERGGRIGENDGRSSARKCEEAQRDSA